MQYGYVTQMRLRLRKLLGINTSQTQFAMTLHPSFIGGFSQFCSLYGTTRNNPSTNLGRDFGFAKGSQGRRAPSKCWDCTPNKPDHFLPKASFTRRQVVDAMQREALVALYNEP
jgi:hypothetical protein